MLSNTANPKRTQPRRLDRHNRKCTICRHEKRKQIEEEFVDWGASDRIVREYGLDGRACLFRHAHAFGLDEKRRRNLRSLLERFLERAEMVQPSPATIISAAHLLAKINARGEWFDYALAQRRERIFQRMTSEELDDYIRKGILPEWFWKEYSGDLLSPL